ncbi:MAG: hypothetical protein ABF297_06805, partial [Thiogranum sp.]
RYSHKPFVVNASLPPEKDKPGSHVSEGQKGLAISRNVANHWSHEIILQAPWRGNEHLYRCPHGLKIKNTAHLEKPE